MLRFLFRLLATFALTVAVIMAVLDATRSVAAQHLVMTPLATSWSAFSPDSLSAVQTFASTSIHPLVWDPVIVRLLHMPGFAVVGVLAFLLYAAGHRPQRRPRRLSPYA